MHTRNVEAERGALLQLYPKEVEQCAITIKNNVQVEGGGVWFGVVWGCGRALESGGSLGVMSRRGLPQAAQVSVA